MGRYRVIGRLAAGGMAEILLAAIDGAAGISRPVVVKRVLPKLAKREDFRRMFVDEARIVSNLRHANVVSVLELGEDSDALYLVMEYLEGESLDVLLRRVAGAGERIDPVLAAHIVAEACAGLHAAHEHTDADGAPQHVVHRDVSPHNLFLGYDGSVKVIDFGIAKAVNRETKTETGTVKGKFAYMSPEQIDGSRVDRRTDVFALGVVLWEMLVGKRLFQRANHLEIVKAICFAPIPAPREVDPRVAEPLDRVAQKALARDLDERYASAAEMRRDLALAMRELAPGSLPTDDLARLMARTFPERIEAKRDLLRKIATGSQITSVPVAIDVDVDELDEPDHAPEARPRSAPAPTLADAPSRPTRSIAIAVIGAAAIGAGALALWAATRPEDAAIEPPSAPAPPSTPEPTLTHAAEPEPAAEPATPTSITVQIDTIPPGAEVRIGSEARGTTPLALTLPRSEDVMAIDLVLDGYRPATEAILPSVDQRVRVALERLPRARTATPRAHDDPPPSATGSRPIFRVD